MLCVLFATILVFLTLLSTGSLCASEVVGDVNSLVSLTGTINQPADDVAANLSVVVVCGVTGTVLETAPVIDRSRFTLYRLAEKTGRYHIHVVGSVAREYNRIVATIEEKKLIATFPRFRPEHNQILPKDILGENNRGNEASSLSSSSSSSSTVAEATNEKSETDTSESSDIDKTPRLHFIPLRRTRFRKPKRKTGFRYYALYIPLKLWWNRMYVFGTLGLVFMVWFPHIIHRLPPEMREELIGEKEPDLGDPNRLIKSLLGEDAFSVKSDQSILSNGSR